MQFDNGSGATLNRVTGANVSSIDGLLSGTGSVYLINPNGVIVGRSGVVSVGGSFVASTLDVTNSNFLAGGDLTFTGSSPAAVINYGKVGALGGDVALIAARVENDGAITAANGTAGLIAGYSVVLRDAAVDDGKFSVLVGGTGTSVTNGGVIAAANAELRAEGGNVYALAGDTAGVIRATGVKADQGKVWLVADGGTLSVAGSITAQGANGAGGAIETSGHNVTVGKALIDAHDGTWLVDPADLTIDSTAATTINASLNAGTSVTEQTTATTSSGAGTANANGDGDIIVAAPLSWFTAAGLTLSAYRNVDVEAQITASGGGALTLIADNSGAANGGTLLFNGGSVQFSGSNRGQPTGSLAIGVGSGAPTNYVLVSDLTTLSNDIAANNSGDYALAVPVDASVGGTITYTNRIPIASTASTPFAGMLEGLGNTISNLTINSSLYYDEGPINLGLFGLIGSSGTVRDLGLVQVSINASTNSNMANFVAGGLAASDAGTVIDVYDTGSVYVNLGTAGGLIGIVSGGTIVNASSAAAVTGAGYGDLGGLIGLANNQVLADGTIRAVSVMGSSASGAVTNSSPYYRTDQDAGSIGGLIGELDGGVDSNGLIGGLVSNSSASGTVSATGVEDAIGGLIGTTREAQVTGDYSTGPVTSSESNAGGLVGTAFGTTIFKSFATGAVQTTLDDSGGLVGEVVGPNGETSLISMVSDSYATGSVAGLYAGGLVGDNAGMITGSYAAGAVSGSGSGGLVGHNSGSISDAYATGPVSGATSSFSFIQSGVGGLVGANEGTISSAYASGAVNAYGSTPAGGLIGTNISGIVANGYYDQSTTGLTTGTSGEADTQSGITAIGGATNLSPYSTSTYTGFDFGSTWTMVEGATRPLLRSEYSTTITNGHQLQLIYLNPTASYTLAADIDLGAELANAANVWNPAVGFTPIGSGAANFAGTFNGAGHAINGLSVDLPSSYDVGLFGFVGSGGTVENLSLAGGKVTGDSYVGELAGQNYGILFNDHVTGFSVASNANSGDLVGYNDGAVTGSSATGWSVGGYNAGGLVGVNGAGGTVTGSDALGAVQGVQFVGGLVGSNAGTISQSYATGDVTASSAVVGGFVGYNTGAISNVYATGWAAAGGYVAGGLVLQLRIVSLVVTECGGGLMTSSP